MKNSLGGKGANLAEMAKLNLPVPSGFTISTEFCTAFFAFEALRRTMLIYSACGSR